MSFEVRFSASAPDDLMRMHQYILDRAASIEDLRLVDQAVDRIEASCKTQLSSTPYSFRKAGANPLRRELIIPFGNSGYVALYDSEHASRVLVLTVRHQLEADYH